MSESKTIDLVLNNGEFHCIIPEFITKISGNAVELRIHTTDGSVLKIDKQNPDAARSFLDQVERFFPNLPKVVTTAMDDVAPANDGYSEQSRAEGQGLPQAAFRSGKVEL